MEVFENVVEPLFLEPLLPRPLFQVCTPGSGKQLRKRGKGSPPIGTRG